MTQDDIPNIDKPYYEIEKILRWCKIKKNGKVLKEYLVLWKGYPIEDAMWIRAQKFSHPRQLQEYLKEDKPLEEKVQVVGSPLIWRGSSCDVLVDC